MAALVGQGRRPDPLGAIQSLAMEESLLAPRDQPTHGQPAIRVRSRGDRLATEWQGRAAQAVDGVRDWADRVMEKILRHSC